MTAVLFAFPAGLLVFLCSCSSLATRYIGYRMCPDAVVTSGQIVINLPENVCLQGQVTIYLDGYAIPHIRADNEHDLYFAVGFMQGRDRRFQLELFKLLGYGRMRELIGDRDSSGVMRRLEYISRALGFYQDGLRLYREAPERDRRLLEAFAEGVNAATETEAVPMEFRLLSYAPEAWEPEDAMAIIALDAFGLCKNWEMELMRLELVLHQLRTGGTIERALQIYPPMFEWPPFLVGEGFPAAGGAIAPASADVVAPELREYLIEFAARSPLPERDTKKQTSQAGAPVPVLGPSGDCGPLGSSVRGNSGSNNWAVDGVWTGTGKAALASDPHLPHMLPPAGYLLHINYTGGAASKRGSTREDRPPAYNVIGGTFAGLPAIAFGTNGMVAWGVTSNWADVTDLYIEKPVPGRDGFYFYEGREIPFTTRTEEFRIRRNDGGFDVETHMVRESVHGVLVNDFVDRIGEDFPLVALKRNRELGVPVSALLDLYVSQSVEEAADAAERIHVFSSHWALADARGSIGYTGSFYLPARCAHAGTFPVPGWTGSFEWGDRIDCSALPRLINPRTGYLATANQQVYPPRDCPFPVNMEGNVPFRYERIMNLLQPGCGGEQAAGQNVHEASQDVVGTEQVSPASLSPIARRLGEIQTDGLFLGWEHVRAGITAALTSLLDDADPLVSTAASILLTWNGECRPAADAGVAESKSSPVAPTLFYSLSALAMSMALRDEVPEETLDFFLTYFNMEPFVYHLLSMPSNPAWDDRSTDERESYTDMLREAFRRAVGALRHEYGDAIDEWTWNRASPFYIKHPFGRSKAVENYLNRGPIVTGGMTGTVNAHQSERIGLVHFPVKNGPILRVSIDLNDLPGSFMSLPGGVSGRPSSAHYDDILPLYIAGSGASMEMDFERIRKGACGEIVFR